MTSIEHIGSPTDRRVGVYFGLRDHQLRMDRERADPALRAVFIAEGERLIAAALDAGLEVVSMLRSVQHPTEVESRLPEGAPLYTVDDSTAVSLTGMHIHRGALACFVRPPVLSLEQVAHPGASTLLVADRVTNPTNLGVMTRSAAGLGVDGMVLDEVSCDPLYRRAHRVAMGASLTLPWTRVPDLPAALERLRAGGFTTVAMALSEDAVDLNRLPRLERVALMMGNEFHGLSAAILAAADVVARIPMTGAVDSLNVAAAAAVACWEITRSHRDG